MNSIIFEFNLKELEEKGKTIDPAIKRFMIYNSPVYHKIINEEDTLQYKYSPVIIRKAHVDRMQEMLIGKEYNDVADVIPVSPLMDYYEEFPLEFKFNTQTWHPSNGS